MCEAEQEREQNFGFTVSLLQFKQFIVDSLMERVVRQYIIHHFESGGGGGCMYTHKTYRGTCNTLNQTYLTGMSRGVRRMLWEHEA